MQFKSFYRKKTFPFQEYAFFFSLTLLVKVSVIQINSKENFQILEVFLPGHKNDLVD